MKKIRLDVGALEVLTFATERPVSAPRGTVEGHVAGTANTDCNQNTCMCLLAATDYYTCDMATAVATCDSTCVGGVC